MVINFYILINNSIQHINIKSIIYKPIINRYNYKTVKLT